MLHSTGKVKELLPPHFTKKKGEAAVKSSTKRPCGAARQWDRSSPWQKQYPIIKSSNHHPFSCNFLVKSDPKLKIWSLIHHWTTKIPPKKEKRSRVFLLLGQGICLIRSVENATTTTTTTTTSTAIRSTIGSTWLSLRSALSEAWSASKRLKGNGPDQEAIGRRTTWNPKQPFLFGGFNPFEKYSSKWESSPNRDENEKYLKPPPSNKRLFQLDDEPNLYTGNGWKSKKPPL